MNWERVERDAFHGVCPRDVKRDAGEGKESEQKAKYERQNWTTVIRSVARLPIIRGAVRIVRHSKNFSPKGAANGLPVGRRSPNEADDVVQPVIVPETNRLKELKRRWPQATLPTSCVGGRRQCKSSALDELPTVSELPRLV